MLNSNNDFSCHPKILKCSGNKLFERPRSLSKKKNCCLTSYEVMPAPPSDKISITGKTEPGSKRVNAESVFVVAD